MEEINLPEKVDVIISEWMGYFLLRESMFDSVICARDRWLKPTGVLYPSHARMWMAPVRSGLGDQKMTDFEAAMTDWYNFVVDTENNYGVNMNVLTKSYREEHEKYYLKTSLWNNIHPSQIIGTSAVIKEIDCLTATVDDIRNVTAKFSLPIHVDRSRLSAFAGWFDVQFRGSMENPAENEIELTTAPSIENSTHWGQQVFLVHPPLRVNEGDEVIVDLSMSRSKDNHRLMDVNITYELQLSSGKHLKPTSTKYFIECFFAEHAHCLLLLELSFCDFCLLMRKKERLHILQEKALLVKCLFNSYFFHPSEVRCWFLFECFLNCADAILKLE
ncbi:hypothetical protein HPP92_019968 [Vanilla planifolia]|uniref:Protein arginine N-methyltransferase domain-containing protein n=1 Tax=Vanilla planifolia TaxID=51239 RepID=A0A835UI17_VANPL|nr:hypothetical protein HPP92_019968 [Vanilla planifolia]